MLTPIGLVLASRTSASDSRTVLDRDRVDVLARFFAIAHVLDAHCAGRSESELHRFPLGALFDRRYPFPSRDCFRHCSVQSRRGTYRATFLQMATTTTLDRRVRRSRLTCPGASAPWRKARGAKPERAASGVGLRSVSDPGSETIDLPAGVRRVRASDGEAVGGSPRLTSTYTQRVRLTPVTAARQTNVDKLSQIIGITALFTVKFVPRSVSSRLSGIFFNF